MNTGTYSVQFNKLKIYNLNAYIYIYIYIYILIIEANVMRVPS